jgi:hypothetical protein
MSKEGEPGDRGIVFDRGNPRTGGPHQYDRRSVSASG